MPSTGKDLKVKGLKIDRMYTTVGVHPFDAIEWEERDASITNEKGEVIFEQKEVEVPKSWSQLALNVVASKYFNGKMDSPGRERSVKQLINRVSRTIADWGIKDGYFASEEDGESFYDELTHLLANQMVSFNSRCGSTSGLSPSLRPQRALSIPSRTLWSLS